MSHKKPGNLILAIDQGTTGTTAMIVDQKLRVLAVKNVEFRQIYPKPGWVEHNLEDIWNSTLKALGSVLRLVPGASKKIAAIGITNQRETVCFWSRKTKKPLCNAIVWQDRRTADLCEVHRLCNDEPMVQEKTGLVIDPYFSGSKIQWALNKIDKVRLAAKKQDCAIGTIDSFLVYRLTAGVSHVTEPSNASRTLLFNIHTLEWDTDMLSLFGVPESVLPDVLGSTAEFGKTKKVPGLPDGIPIHGILGDQQSALLGQACIQKGMAKCTYGTGSFILMNTGDKPTPSQFRLLTTIAWQIGGKTTYALEGGAFTAGASVQWTRDGLQMIKKSSEIEKLARSVRSSDGVIFVPAFTGVGAPYWLPNIRASFFGISRGTNRGHLARAVLEGIAFMNHDILRAMEKDLGSRLKSLNVDGGASKNDYLMQFQSDILNTRLIRPKMVETTALGAVFAAGLGVGLWKDLKEISKSWKMEKTFLPRMDSKTRKQLVRTWSRTMECLKQMN